MKAIFYPHMFLLFGLVNFYPQKSFFEQSDQKQGL